jgi:hypothetical protein
MVAQQTLDLLVGVQILPGEVLEESLPGSFIDPWSLVAYWHSSESDGPFVYRLGQKILNL